MPSLDTRYINESRIYRPYLSRVPLILVLAKDSTIAKLHSVWCESDRSNAAETQLRVGCIPFAFALVKAHRETLPSLDPLSRRGNFPIELQEASVKFAIPKSYMSCTLAWTTSFVSQTLLV
jgi:hypothetical protein